MNNDEFFLAELGVIGLTDVEAYGPDEFQMRYLQLLEEGINTHDHKLRLHLLELAGDNNRIPRQPDGTALSDVELPFTFEHIKFVIQMRTARMAGLGMLKHIDDPLQKILNPAFELLKNLSGEHEAFYVEDLNRRWKIAGDACGWEGVFDVPNRKIALTGSPIWKMLGSAELFEDGLFDTPPFYLNGGWLFGWEWVSEKELENP